MEPRFHQCHAGTRSPRRWLHTCLVALCLTSAYVPPACADAAQADLQIAARALTFLADPPAGRVRVGILYSPGSPASRAQAEDLRDLIGDGLEVGNIELVGELVEIAAAGGSAADLFFVTEYIDGAALEGAVLGTRRGRLCMTLDMTHVENGTCELGVRSTPKVAILVNREAASASGLRFATAFRVMITEI